MRVQPGPLPDDPLAADSGIRDSLGIASLEHVENAYAVVPMTGSAYGLTILPMTTQMVYLLLGLSRRDVLETS